MIKNFENFVIENLSEDTKIVWYHGSVSDITKDDLDKVIDYKTRFSNYISSLENDISKISWCFKLLFAKNGRDIDVTTGVFTEINGLTDILINANSSFFYRPLYYTPPPPSISSDIYFNIELIQFSSEIQDVIKGADVLVLVIPSIHIETSLGQLPKDIFVNKKN